MAGLFLTYGQAMQATISSLHLPGYFTLKTISQKLMARKAICLQ
jgi:ABC-type Zn2+ transport system substrate-binding protein/surface adhesin